jgi:hypothetical protein
MILIAGTIVGIGLLLFGLCFYLGTTPTAVSGDYPNIRRWFGGGLGLFISSIIVALLIMFGLPQYNVWEQGKRGEAELAKAEQNRQIAIQEAKAKEESAKSLANARIIEAKGISEANKIIGDSLQNNDAYIHYLWIEALKESKDQVIYVPTEAGIPITESARFFKRHSTPMVTTPSE